MPALQLVTLVNTALDFSTEGLKTLDAYKERLMPGTREGCHKSSVGAVDTTIPANVARMRAAR